MSQSDHVGERTILIKRRLRYTERSCAVCGGAFVGWGRARFCSEPCRSKWDYEKHAEQRRASRRERYSRQKQEREP
jgi:hypothetical protein